MDLLWRLETRAGKGAYSSFTYRPGNRNDYCNPALHPAPYGSETVGEFEQGLHIFGFTSLAAARRWWFDVDDLRAWHAEGLRLALWPQGHCTEILADNYQCAFRRPDAAPLYLPAFAIHDINEETLVAMAADHFNLTENTHD